MKTVLATLALGLLLLPAPAAANTPNQCRALNTQTEHYAGMFQRAHDLGNEMWQERIGGHLENLLARRASLCPEYTEDDGTMRMLAGLLKFAAQAALTYFTFGAF